MNRREFLASLTAAAAAAALPVPVQALPGGWVLDGDTLVLRGATIDNLALCDAPDVGHRVLVEHCKILCRKSLALSCGKHFTVRNCTLVYSPGWPDMFGAGRTLTHRIDIRSGA